MTKININEIIMAKIKMVKLTSNKVNMANLNNE